MKCRRLATWKDEQGIEHKDIVWFGSMGTKPKSIRPDLTFANATWEEITQVCGLGKHKDYFKVGDTRPITLITDPNNTIGGSSIAYDCNLIIIDFDHDDLANGQGKACMTVTFDEAISPEHANFSIVGSTVTTAESWKDSQLRLIQSEEMLKDMIRGDSPIGQAIVEVTKRSSTNSFSIDDIVETADKLFCMSATEVDATKTNAVLLAEGSTYDYFKTDSQLKRTVKGHTMNTKGEYPTSAPWTLRSHASSKNRYMYVSNGTVSINERISENVPRWAFCIGQVGMSAVDTVWFNPDNKHDNYSDKQQGVVDSLTQRLSVIRRELWYDVNYGLPLLDKQKSKVAIDAFIGKTVLAHPDVDSIQDFDSKIINKVYTCSMKIITKYGEIILNV